MTRFRHRCPPFLLLLVLILTSASWVGAQDSAKIPGLAVGAEAPAFALPDQRGQRHELAKLLKKGTVAIVFYRSADW